MEKSLVLVKPDAVARGLSFTILGRIEKSGLKIVALKMLQLSRALAERHYAAHRGKGFFPGLINYITSGPIVAAVFEGDNAINRIRDLMGATDPIKAAPGTMRRDFGLDIEKNAVHGSDSPETAAVEIALYFAGGEITEYQLE
jgi:nucleoside-diphosphate kinase